MIATSNVKAIIGTGITGLSVARFLTKLGRSFVLMDTRENPPHLAQIKKEFPDCTLLTGNLDLPTLLATSEIILSPGVAQSTVEIVAAKNAGIPVIGDIELFVRYAKAPIVAITGSNAKSTVTTLVGEMAKAAGIKVAVGGNLGTPALDLLQDDIQLYVMELSSFQLETVTKLNAKAATILNISSDHLDRYQNMREYILAKMRIYFGAQHIIVNRNDLLTHPPLAQGVAPIQFGGKADFKSFGLLEDNGREYLAKNLTALMPVNELKIRGRHNIENALAALALGDAAGIPMDAMLTALRNFKGLRHRCEFVAQIKGVEFYNDSKGTNIGATVAAIKGLARDPHRLTVILGGEGKGQDFSELVPALNNINAHAILIGRDAPIIEAAIEKTIPVSRAQNLSDAIQQSLDISKLGDAVLLSPACASFDMFKNYEDRGEQYCKLVLEAQS